jgi:chromosome segregation and condensation protein ScpB
MQDESSHRSAERDDWRTQRTVLALLLFASPNPVRQKLLAEEMDDSEAVERAISELETVGLVWRDGRTVMPTLAARHMNWLELA